ncbi:hypothetical protein [Streptomyces sp. NPDC001348]
MGEIVVVYELDKPNATHASPDPDGEERPVRRVHAAPTAPGAPAATGPRTLCGKDTFAMRTASRTSAEAPGGRWYPARYAPLVCPDCAAVIET